MEKKTVGILVSVVAGLLLGVSGLSIALAAGIPSLLFSYMPALQGSLLGINGGGNVPNFGFITEAGSCCLCIPIPLVLGLFALNKQANGSFITE